MFPAVLTSFLFALTGLCATQSARIFGSAKANLLRLLVALALLTLWAHLFGKGWSGASFGWFALAGGIGFGIGGWCMFQALNRLGSTLSLLIVETASAFFAGLFSWHLLNAELTATQMGFALLTLAGVVLGLLPNVKSGIPKEAIVFGSLMAVIASAAQGVSFTLSKYAFIVMAQAGEPIDKLTASYQRLLGGTAIALTLFVVGLMVRGSFASKENRPAKLASTLNRYPHMSRPYNIPGPVWVLLNALFGPILGVACMLWAISKVGNPGIVQTVVATATLMTLPLARKLENTRMGWNYFVGCLLSIFGIAGLVGVLT